MKRWKAIGICACVLLLPGIVLAQTVTEDIHSLHEVLTNLRKELLPLCSKLIGVGRALAGFAATWYIGSRVWRSLAAAEPIDFYPLFRPFALGLALLYFPAVIDIMDGVLEPTVSATSQLVEDSNKAIAVLLKQKQDEIKETDQWKALVGDRGEGNREEWMKYYRKDEVGNEGFFGRLGNDVSFSLAKMSYNFRNSIKQAIATILQILYEAAALCINALRTFKLLILAIVGPLVFGLAVFDGFQHILQVYFSRYINIFLWLPVANILGALLGKIQENMIRIDITQVMQTGDPFFSSYDLGYMIFMIIGIMCYLTVPSIVDEIIFVGGGGGMQQKATGLFNRTTSSVIFGTTATTSGMANDMYNDMRSMVAGGIAVSSAGNYFPDPNHHQRSQLSGTP